MVKVDEAFEVRYKKGGNQFEVLVDFEKLNEYKKKHYAISVYDVLADVKIFKDQKKGDVASEILLKESFRGLSEDEILEEILLRGECQIPTSYTNKLREEKKMQVVNYIVENAVNPATKGKYTASMIESEINKLKFNFDPYIIFENQSEEVLKGLKKVIAISIDKIVLEVEIPPKYLGSFYGPFRKFGKILKEYYDRNGNLKIKLEITESLQDKVIDYIKHHTSGEGSYFISKD
ncbi:MAG: ribosome assembly factor SBDS [Candidatus Woesearchaeota archaeon]|jgi:ribosome maturation protein SDO1|nr:ribosome assembly factor SBDS [Candidatus Woesearchaeota archaeon]